MNQLYLVQLLHMQAEAAEVFVEVELRALAGALAELAEEAPELVQQILLPAEPNT